MIHIALIPEQRQVLEKARRIRTSNLAECCVAILCSDRGQRGPAIAESMGCHAHTIRRGLNAYRHGGIARRKRTPPVGRPNGTEHAALRIVQPVLAQHPRASGSLEAGWSTPLLVDSLPKPGLEASESPVKRALKRGGGVYKRFAKTMPAHAPSSEEKKRGWTRWSTPSS